MPSLEMSMISGKQNQGKEQTHFLGYHRQEVGTHKRININVSNILDYITVLLKVKTIKDGVSEVWQVPFR